MEVHYYLPDEGAELMPTLALDQLHFSMLKRSTHPTVSMTWRWQSDEQDASEGTLVLLGASAWESDADKTLLHSAMAADVLIFAAHGPVVKSTYSLTEWTNIPDVVLFANGDVSAAIEPSPDVAVVLRRARLIFGDEATEITLP